jgi:NADH-quinone oxidoreductase subunit A
VYFEFANVLVFSVLAVAFVILNLVIAKLLRPKSTYEAGKVAIYECGEPTVGQAWVRFDIRFYTVALMFVIFDVEVALLFPWAVVFRDLVDNGLGAIAFIEAGAFILILMAGLAYVWRRGDIDWTDIIRSRGQGGERIESAVPHAGGPVRETVGASAAQTGETHGS